VERHAVVAGVVALLRSLVPRQLFDGLAGGAYQEANPLARFDHVLQTRQAGLWLTLVAAEPAASWTATGVRTPSSISDRDMDV
jgi:hypothetical protein